MVHSIKTAKKNLIIMAGVIVAVGAAWYGLIINPQQVRIETLSADISRLVRMIESATVEQKQITVLEKSVTQLNDSLTALEARLFERAKVPAILQRIVENGGRARLDFSGIYPKYGDLLISARNSDSPLLQLPVEMVFTGAFKNIGVFVEGLQHQDYLLSIERIEMAVSPEIYPDIRVVVRGTLFLRNAQQAQAVVQLLNRTAGQIQALAAE